MKQCRHKPWFNIEELVWRTPVRTPVAGQAVTVASFCCFCEVFVEFFPLLRPLPFCMSCILSLAVAVHHMAFQLNATNSIRGFVSRRLGLCGRPMSGTCAYCPVNDRGFSVIWTQKCGDQSPMKRLSFFHIKPSSAELDRWIKAINSHLFRSPSAVSC